MTDKLARIENAIFKITGQKIAAVSDEKECEEYFGMNFRLDQLSIKFRIAKTTPTKTGQFVTLWKRNPENKTEPFHLDDEFDFYIVVAEQDGHYGFFFFPKHILSKNQILTNNQKVGKRGFRVYPSWAKTQSKQAKKTQSWQTEYFIDLNNEPESLQKGSLILQRVFS